MYRGEEGNNSLNFCIHTIIGGSGPPIFPNGHEFMAATSRHKFSGQFVGDLVTSIMGRQTF
jgi:hypothetical protein